jgi:predicted anti-sigma-YlaC factor YlaD
MTCDELKAIAGRPLAESTQEQRISVAEHVKTCADCRLNFATVCHQGRSMPLEQLRAMAREDRAEAQRQGRYK